ncbi:uncharacterized protein LOC116248869 isoform X1 [Nymphaea colorata]|nr:uncharacterized protein LOC116248869 isoform X1 [Nymphaea colorata]
MASEEQRKEQTRSESYKIKTVSFFDREVPIILQNDNGPCPLLAICNVLSLRNSLNANWDASEIPQQRLLHLVGERLLDTNNAENKDAGYMKNQQQNIADAFELVPSLATGIDVNVRFRNIHDFEFTPVCAIFDLLEIDLVHGWIIDPQDADTASAIGSNSYNTLMEKLVALEASNIQKESTSQEDCVDFAAATTATLGVPSPCLSRLRSFEEPPIAVSLHENKRKGDVEEVEQLMKVLELSKSDASVTTDGHLSPESLDVPQTPEDPKAGEDQRPSEAEEHNQEECTILSASFSGGSSSETTPEATILLAQKSSESCPVQTSENHVGLVPSGENGTTNESFHDEPFCFPDSSDACPDSTCKIHLCGSPKEQETLTDPENFLNPCNKTSNSNFPSVVADTNTDSSVTDGEHDLADVPMDATSSLDGSEPIYEGEDFVQDAGLAMYESPEPMYEGEMILAKQADREKEDGCSRQSIDEDPQPNHGSTSPTPREGELIRNFLTNNASQLTIYGLFCLQEHLKEHSLCVFFRNNHFSTMFKHEGQLYLLATDQGYINQPDLVWEKLNEVNGDTVFMTGNFEEFKVGNEAGGSWDQQNAMNSTAEYLARMDKAALTDSTMSSDLQLAIALQQQEFGNQTQHQNSQNVQPPPARGSRLITGPEVRRTTAASTPRNEAKSKEKEKCVLM